MTLMLKLHARTFYDLVIIWLSRTQYHYSVSSILRPMKTLSDLPCETTDQSYLVVDNVLFPWDYSFFIARFRSYVLSIESAGSVRVSSPEQDVVS